MFEIRKDKRTGSFKKFIGYMLILSLIFANITGLQVQAAETKENKKVIYLNGETGSDKKDGTTPEQAVLTVTKAKELLAKTEEGKTAKGGVVKITGKITIQKEASYHYVTFETELEGPVIIVKEDAELTLEQVSITGISDTLIENQGLVKLKNTNTFKKDTEILGDSAISSKDKGKVEKIIEKLVNDLSISCENVTYGNPLSPVVLTNVSTAEVNYSYKTSGLDDSSYHEGLPTAVGTYTIKATSKETDTYQASVAYADATITKANPIEVIFPDAESNHIGTRLGDLALSQGQGAGTFSWVNPDAEIESGVNFHQVKFIPDDVSNYDYSNIQGFDQNIGAVLQSIPVEGLPLKAPETESKETEVKETETQETETQETKAQETKSQETEEVQEESKETETTIEIPESVAKVEEQIVSLPEKLTSQDIDKLVEIYRSYESLQDGEKAMITSVGMKKLDQAKEQASKINRTSNGVTVEADVLPWYVQLQAQLKENSEHSQDAKVDEIILPYELKLWNLLEDQEYHLPEGKKAIVYMPVNHLDQYENLVIVHYLDNGEVEYITPTISGNTVIFETTSFSPFDLAGSQVIIGANPSKGTSNTSTNTGKNTTNKNDSNKNNNKTNTSTTNNNKNKTNTNNKNNNKPSGMVTPKTSDTTAILPFIILLVVAAVVLAAVVVMNKKKSNKDNQEESEENNDSEIK